MLTGSIIFLTPRKEKPIYRIIVSKGIALFTRKKGQKLNEVKTHSAVIYKWKNVYYVRDMDKNGDDHYTLKEYKEKYKDRIEIREFPFKATKEEIREFNKSCRDTKVKYDFWNTFFFQVIKRITGLFIGTITTYHRMCAEDVQRQVNILKYLFLTPESTNPNELYGMVKYWNEIK